jgi:pimeloyl-ACP methyl ester carboxylesterase
MKVPGAFEEMGDFVADFLHAIDLPLVDVLGFSIGGAVAQALVMRHPEAGRAFWERRHQPSIRR